MREDLLLKLSYKPTYTNLADIFSPLKAPFVFLESSRKSIEDKRDLLFYDPIEEIVFTGRDSPKDFFRRIEQALSQGFWLAGFFTYEFGYFLENRLISYLKRPSITPFAWFGVFKRPLCFTDKLFSSQKEEIKFSSIRLNMEYSEYKEAFNQIKKYIACGDTYQVNFTLKYHFRVERPHEALYLALRERQRVYYAGFIKTKNFSVLSLSPELFLRREGVRIWTSPMKGTAPRGKFLEEDEAIGYRLSSDSKNQAENVMILDLLRNDLGRVCIPGTVFPRSVFKVERYETLHQMISTIEGALSKDCSLYQIFSSLFPCGSVTGAPKIRTMEIIAELEKEPRGVYTGAIGFFSPEGDFVFNVAIRTLVLTQDFGEFGIGSGVVWDSDPLQEYEECRLKARFLLEDEPDFKLLETMLFLPEKGYPLRELHINRLSRSARYFDFPFEKERVEEILHKAANHLTTPAKVRLLLDKLGGLELEAYALKPIRAPIKIGILKRLCSKEERFLYHKTTYRPWYQEARKMAEEEGLFDIVFVDEDGELSEGTISNLFVEKDGKLLTPRISAGLLRGVFRESLLCCGKAQESKVTIKDLETAESIYLGNAVRGLIRVEKWVKL